MTNPHFVIKFKSIGKEHTLEGSVVGKVNKDVLYSADEILDVFDQKVIKSRSNASFESTILALFVAGALEELMEALGEWVDNRKLDDSQLAKLDKFSKYLEAVLSEFVTTMEAQLKEENELSTESE